MKLVIRAEELNFTIYKYLMENGYEHTAFCFRQEADLPASLVLHSEIPPPKDAQIGASSSRHKLKNYFPAHCLITLMHKAMLYLWIEYHTDLATKKLTQCDSAFSLFKSHTCKPPSRASGSTTNLTAARGKRKAPPSDAAPPTANAVAQDDNLNRADTTTTSPVVVEPSPSPSLQGRRTSHTNAFRPPRGAFDFLESGQSNSHTLARCKTHNNVTVAAKVRANDILIGRKRDAEWKVVGSIEQPANLKPSVMEFSPRLSCIVIWWENTATNSGDVCLYELYDDYISQLSLGDAALQLINVRSIRWSADRPLFRVNGTGRRDTYAVMFQKIDGQWNLAR